MQVTSQGQADGHPAEATPAYLDCAATTRLAPEVLEEVVRFLDVDYGNAGSRTHAFGAIASGRIGRAREEIAGLAAAEPAGVLFTSGATEANNLAILGLERELRERKLSHVVTTAIEHKAVLEPVAFLEKRGFQVTSVRPREDGAVHPEDVAAAITDKTGLVSVMHANNETGAVQEIEGIGRLIPESVFFHVDGAQSFGKLKIDMETSRIDLLSCSAHKLYGPKGVGALIMRRSGFAFPPLEPLTHGGGQERGLRPGTHPVHLIAGFGTACGLASKAMDLRREKAVSDRAKVLGALSPLSPKTNGALEACLPHIFSVWLPGVDAEALLVATKDLWCVAVGSACTSAAHEPSHVLVAMGLDDKKAAQSIRISPSCFDSVDEAMLAEVVRRGRALKSA